MRSLVHQWPNSVAASNVSYIAQLFAESLSLESFASFRVPTLDAIARVAELNQLLTDFLEKRIPSVALEPSLQELNVTLEKDPIAFSISGDKIAYFQEAYHGIPKDDHQAREMKAFLLSLFKSLVRSYRTVLEERVCSLYDDRKAKIELAMLISLYAAYLINRGYSRQFLLSIVQARFFSAPVKKVERRTLKRFFRTFSEEDLQFKVSLPITPLFAAYLDKMELKKVKVAEFGSLDLLAQAELQLTPEFRTTDKYVVMTLQAKDPYTAFSNFREVLLSLSAFSFIHRHGIEIDLKRYAFVQAARSTVGNVIELDAIVFQLTATAITKRIAHDLKATSRQVLTRFDNASTERLMNAIRTSALARSTSSAESQLISLWSAVEVLLSDPSAGRARIVHYVDLLTPCICHKYVRQYIRAVVDELAASYHKQFYKIINSVDVDDKIDEYSRFTYLLLIERFENQRTAICAMLSENPLALHRVWKLRENLKSYGAVEKTIASHEARVRWQLHRIYRVRNLLVHNGSVPVFLTPLVMNAFEYLRAAMTTILARSNLEAGTLNVDQVVSEIGIEYSVMRNSLARMSRQRKDEGIAVDDFGIYVR